MNTSAHTTLDDSTAGEDLVIENLSAALGEDAMPGTCICWNDAALTA